MKSVLIQDVKEFEKGNNLLLEVEDEFIIQMVYLAVHEYSDCDCGNLETRLAASLHSDLLQPPLMEKVSRLLLLIYTIVPLIHEVMFFLLWLLVMLVI